MLFVIGLPPKFAKLSNISWKIWKFWKRILVDQIHSGGEGEPFEFFLEGSCPDRSVSFLDHSSTKTNPTVSSYLVHFANWMKCVEKCQKIAGCYQCAVYCSRPPIASKPGSSPSERPGLHNIMRRNLPPYDRFWYFVLSFPSTRAWQSGSKHSQRWWEGRLRQTMVDLYCCLDLIVSERMSQVSRQSEVGNHKRRTVLRWTLLSDVYFVHFLTLCL